MYSVPGTLGGYQRASGFLVFWFSGFLVEA